VIFYPFSAWLPSYLLVGFSLLFFFLLILLCYRCAEVSFELDLQKGLLLCAPDLTEDTMTWIEAQDGGWQRLELDSRHDVTGPK
jgi:hypothetical protein